MTNFDGIPNDQEDREMTEEQTPGTEIELQWEMPPAIHEAIRTLVHATFRQGYDYGTKVGIAAGVDAGVKAAVEARGGPVTVKKVIRDTEGRILEVQEQQLPFEGAQP